MTILSNHFHIPKNARENTPPKTPRISGLKSNEKWYGIFYFEILLAPSELLLPSAKSLPGTTELARQVSK